MPDPIRLWPEASRTDAGEAVHRATLEIAPQERYDLEFAVPERWTSWITSALAPWAVIAFGFAIERGRDLHVQGPLCPTLLTHLETNARIRAWLHPSWHPIVATADTEASAPPPRFPEQAISAFSGGLDSAFTLFRHQRRLAGRASRTLAGALLVHGFDIALDDRDGWEEAAARAERLTASLGATLLRARTNLRNVPHYWPLIYEYGVAGALHFFQAHAGVGLLPASVTLLNLDTSHPIANAALSSAGFAIETDGILESRPQKIHAMRDWHALHENLRICWQSDNGGKNCGRCEKCIRTFMNYRQAGVDPPPGLPGPRSDLRILTTRINPWLRSGWTEMAVAAVDTPQTRRSTRLIHQTLAFNAAIDPLARLMRPLRRRN